MKDVRKHEVRVGDLVAYTVPSTGIMLVGNVTELEIFHVIIRPMGGRMTLRRLARNVAVLDKEAPQNELYN